MAEERPKCKYFDTNEVCIIVQQLTNDYRYPTPEECSFCTRSEPGQSVNIVTLSISNRMLAEKNLPTLHTGPGPGTRLKKILDWWISTDPDCGCEDRALIMDAWGVEGCIINKRLIVMWLKESANLKGLRIPRQAIEFAVDALLLTSPRQAKAVPE